MVGWTIKCPCGRYWPTEAARSNHVCEVDLHRQAAAEHFGVPYDQVTPEHRRAAKAVAFGASYGIKP